MFSFGYILKNVENVAQEQRIKVTEVKLALK